jgi:hypothetical protein
MEIISNHWLQAQEAVQSAHFENSSIPKNINPGVRSSVPLAQAPLVLFIGSTQVENS